MMHVVQIWSPSLGSNDYLNWVVSGVCVLATKSLCKAEDEEEKFVHTQGHNQVPEGHMLFFVATIAD